MTMLVQCAYPRLVVNWPIVKIIPRHCFKYFTLTKTIIFFNQYKILKIFRLIFKVLRYLYRIASTL